jgi:molybdopterin molybdotransferase
MLPGVITLDEARGLVAARVAALDPVVVPLGEALGCRIAEPPRSDVDSPPGHVSAMDGYAVRHADVGCGGTLPVAFEVQAGTVAGHLPQGCAARIFTGAVLPEGADTVVPQEQASVGENGVVRLESLAAGSHVRRRGEVLAVGAPLAEIGELVTPQLVALMAAAGADRVAVIPRPRVSVVVTGSEVVPVSEVPGPGQIRNSNGPMLDALVRAAGLRAPQSVSAGDTTDDLSLTLSSSIADADLVLTSGGVSVGDYDLVPEVARSLGGEVLFHQVSVKPGKPLLAVRFDGCWMLGLPGNPVSVLAGWRLFGWPLAATLSGDTAAFNEQPMLAELEEAVTNRGDRVELRPAVLTRGQDRLSARVVPWRGSHDLVAAAAANAFARLDVGAAYEVGDPIPCYPL